MVFIVFLNLEPFQNHVGGIYGLHIHRAAIGADVRQVMTMKLVAALITIEQRLNFVKLQNRIFHQLAVLFHNVEAELHMIGTMARESIEADSDPLHAFGPLRGGLLFHCVNDGANEMNFVHNRYFVLRVT